MARSSADINRVSTGQTTVVTGGTTAASTRGDGLVMYRPRSMARLDDTSIVVAEFAGFVVRAVVTNSPCGSVPSDTAAMQLAMRICVADFNCSGQPGAVTVQDIFDYLTAYFAGCV